MGSGLTPLARRRLELRRLGRMLLVMLVAFGAILGALFAYAGSATPLYVVESSSMQHAPDASSIGVLDTGDMFLAQVIHSRADVVTYVEGRARGYATYGDFGDVIIFVDPELLSATPVVHRAMAWATWNASAGGYDVPDLALLPAGDWTGLDANGTVTTAPLGLSQFILRRAGWDGTVNVSVDLAWINAQRGITPEGFLTFGDHNVYRSAVKHDPWVLPFPLVIGRARGEIPWFGLIKLTLAPGAEGCCAGWGSTDLERGAPGNSWVALDVSLALLFGTPLAVSVAEWYLDRHPDKEERLRRSWSNVKRKVWPWSRAKAGEPSSPEDDGETERGS
jgi:signal peptidase